MFKDFIDANRQSGSTTELVWATIRCDGYLVVGNLPIKKRLLEKFPALNADNVYTPGETKDPNGRWKGKPSKPVFFDTSALVAIPEPEGTELMGLTLREVLRRAISPSLTPATHGVMVISGGGGAGGGVSSNGHVPEAGKK